MAATNSELGTNVELGSKDVGLKAGMEQAALAVKGSTGDMEAAFKGLAASMETVLAPLKMFMAVMAGAGVIREGIGAVKEQNAEAMKLAKTLGITAEQANYLKAGLDNAFISEDSYLAATQAMTRATKDGGDKFEQMGIKIKDANGNLLPMQEQIANTVAGLEQYKAGADRNSMALQLLGRGYKDVLEAAKLTEKALADGREEVDKYHKVLNPEMVKAYKVAQKDMADAVEGVTLAIGRGMMPILTEVGEFLSQVGPAATEVMIVAMDTIGDVFNAVKSVAVSLWGMFKTAFSGMTGAVEGTGIRVASFGETIVNVVRICRAIVLGFGLAFELAFSGIQSMVEIVSSAIVAFGMVMKAVLVDRDWGAVQTSWEKGMALVEKTVEDSAKRTVEIQAKYADKIQDALTGSFKGSSAGAQKDPGGTLGATTLKEKTGPDDKRMKAWENELMLAKITYMRENEYREMSLAKEQEFWDGKLAIADLTEKEKDSLTKRRQASEFAELKTTGARILALTQETIDEQKRIDLDRVASAKVNADYMLSTYQINQKDRLALDIEYARQTYDIERAALMQRMELLAKDPTKNAVELAKINGQLLELERKYQLDKTKMVQAAQMENNKWLLTGMKAGEDAFSQSIENMILKGQTLRQSMANIANAIVTSFVQSGAKIAANWAVTELAKTAASKSGAATRTAIEWAAAAESVAAGAWAAIKNIMNSAWEAMAAAYKSIAAIPLVGPVLAPVAAAGAFAGVSSLAGSIASARGGYDIPSGVNPMTQLHEREMVLPKEQADAVRNMTGNGGGTYHFNVTAMDSRSVKQFLQDNAPAVAAAMKTAQRNFAG